MAGFEKFEEIKAWQRARELACKIYELTSKGPFSQDYGLRDQIRRATVSVMANIAEGCGRYSNKEFAGYLNIAKGSASEIQSHLYVALDLGFIDQQQFEEVYLSVDETSRMLYSLWKHLRGSNN